MSENAGWMENFKNEAAPLSSANREFMKRVDERRRVREMESKMAGYTELRCFCLNAALEAFKNVNDPDGIVSAARVYEAYILGTPPA